MWYNGYALRLWRGVLTVKSLTSFNSVEAAHMHTH